MHVRVWFHLCRIYTYFSPIESSPDFKHKVDQQVKANQVAQLVKSAASAEIQVCSDALKKRTRSTPVLAVGASGSILFEPRCDCAGFAGPLQLL